MNGEFSAEAPPALSRVSPLFQPPTQQIEPKVLLVDDDTEILDLLRQHLCEHYRVSTATCAQEALATLAREGTFAVVISDMHMPGMNGAELLARIRQSAPNTTRLLLTGYSTIQDLEVAVNRGGIFRFLTKPCTRDRLHTAVEAAVEQLRLRCAERLLLEETLAGSIDVLTEVVALADPDGFGRARRIKQLIGKLAARLGLPDIWQLEVAAMLYPLGSLRSSPGDRADPVDIDTTVRLLTRIPRLEGVARMIQASRSPIPTSRQEQALEARDVELLGPTLLTLCLELETLDAELGWSERIDDLRASGRFAAPLLEVLGTLSLAPSQAHIHTLSLASLEGTV